MRLLSLILLFVACNVSAATPPKESNARVGESFPDIQFVNPLGVKASLSDYRGKVVVVKLWATWCGICQAKWPLHQALYNAVKDDNQIEVITLSVLEKPEVSQNWVTEQGYTVPLFKNLIPDRGAVAVSDQSLLFIKATPMIFIIDKDGILRQKSIGVGPTIGENSVRQYL